MARRVAAVVLGLACSAVSAQQNTYLADAPVAGSAGGWLDSSPASAALEAMLGEETCTIERRTVESLADGEFQRDYFNKKAVLLRYASAADASVAPPAVSGFEEGWSAAQVKAWLAEQGMDTLAAEAFGEEVDGLMALEMDASDWATLGADAAQVAKIAASLAGARQPLWSREGLKQHCGTWDASIPTVRAIIASDGGDVKFQPLSDYLDYLRDSELQGIVRGGAILLGFCVTFASLFHLKIRSFCSLFAPFHLNICSCLPHVLVQAWTTSPIPSSSARPTWPRRTSTITSSVVRSLTAVRRRPRPSRPRCRTSSTWRQVSGPHLSLMIPY